MSGGAGDRARIYSVQGATEEQQVGAQIVGVAVCWKAQHTVCCGGGWVPGR